MNTTKPPLISVQILNWNRAEESLRAIASAKNQTYNNIEIVFVDNGSSDHSVELVRARYPEIRIVELDQNFGCPGGRNRGIAYCNGDFIFYLDNDGVLHERAVEEAYNTIKTDPSIAVVAGMVYDFERLEEIDPKIEPRSHKIYEYGYFQGGICLHRKTIYEKVGHYPPEFFYGGEEWHLTCKILDKDLKIIRNEAVILWHKRSEIARNRTKELMNTYYNRLHNSISLYPAKYAFLFLFYFPVQYLSYTKKDGFLGAFAKSLFSRFPRTVFRAFKDRNPIRLKTYKKLRELSPNL